MQCEELFDFWKKMLFAPLGKATLVYAFRATVNVALERFFGNLSVRMEVIFGKFSQKWGPQTYFHSKTAKLAITQTLQSVADGALVKIGLKAKRRNEPFFTFSKADRCFQYSRANRRYRKSARALCETAA